MTLNPRDSRGGSAVESFVPQVNRTFSGADYVATTAPYAGNAVLYLKRT